MYILNLFVNNSMLELVALWHLHIIWNTATTPQHGMSLRRQEHDLHFMKEGNMNLMVSLSPLPILANLEDSKGSTTRQLVWNGMQQQLMDHQRTSCLSSYNTPKTIFDNNWWNIQTQIDFWKHLDHCLGIMLLDYLIYSRQQRNWIN